MPEIKVRKLGPEHYARLVEIWAAAVRATHDFLSEEDFNYFHARIAAEYLPNVELYGAFTGAAPEGPESCLGFMGLARPEPGAENSPISVEMLFVDPQAHRRGIGRTLLNHAKGMSGKLLLDVNEQNGGATDFYLHEGFVITGRSPLDPGGKPYPLLHMCFFSRG